MRLEFCGRGWPCAPPRCPCGILRRMRLRTSVYIPGDSPVHRCDARAKVLLLAVYSAAVFWVDGVLGMALFVGGLAACVGLSRVGFARVLAMGVPVYVLAAFTVLFAAVNAEVGALLGCLYAARMIVLVLASLLVTFTTTSTQLSDALGWFVRPLERLRVPVDDVSMVFSLAIRFIPLTALELGIVSDAQFSRGAAFEGEGVMKRLGAWSTVFIPLFVQLFRRADRLSVAMDARCYGLSGERRGQLHPLRWSAASLVALAVGAVLMVAIAWFL